MAIRKITGQEMDANGVCAAPDILNGTTAENKAVFDRMIRQVVAPAYNACAEAVDQVEARVPEWEAAEQVRQEAESGRETAENARVLAEEKRTAAEQSRQAAETQRETAETQRKDAEIKREDQETGYIAQAKYWAEEAQKAAGGGVTSFNGRSGTVKPEFGDYTPEMVGAAPESETTKAQETADQALETANQAQQDANKVLVDASASEETKKLYGLGADATNDDLFKNLSKLSQHKWIKTHFVLQAMPITGNEITTLLDVKPNNYSDFTFLYSDQVQVLPDKTIQLVSPVNLVFNKGNYTKANILKGKYWRYDRDPICFTEAAAPDVTTRQDSRHFTLIEISAKKIEAVTAMQDSLVTSSDANAYPKNQLHGEYFYRYLGESIQSFVNAHLIQSGEYYGTGGITTLTFSIIPKVLIIIGPYSGIEIVRNCKRSRQSSYSSSSDSDCFIDGCVWEKNTVRWTDGCNNARNLYRYVAIG